MREEEGNDDDEDDVDDDDEEIEEDRESKKEEEKKEGRGRSSGVMDDRAAISVTGRSWAEREVSVDCTTLLPMATVEILEAETKGATFAATHWEAKIREFVSISPL